MTEKSINDFVSPRDPPFSMFNECAITKCVCLCLCMGHGVGALVTDSNGLLELNNNNKVGAHTHTNIFCISDIHVKSPTSRTIIDFFNSELSDNFGDVA